MKKVFLIVFLSFWSILTHAQVNYYNEGMEFYNKSDFTNAIKKFDLAIANKYTSAQYIYLYRGLAKYALKQYEQAYIDLNQGIIELNKLGYANIAQMPKEVVDAYASTVFYRGIVQFYRNNFTDAIADYNNALIYRFDAESCYFQIGYCHYNLADYTKAIEYFTVAIGYGPVIKNVYYWRGLSYLNSEKYNESIKDLDEFIKAQPNDSYAYNYRAMAKILGNRNIQDAIQDIRKSVDLKIPELYRVYRNLGLAYEKQNDCKASIEAFQKAISLYPQDAYSESRLKKVQQNCNNKNVSPNDKPVVVGTISPPTISWVYPKEESTETAEKVFVVKTCVSSDEKPDMKLYVQGVDVSASRDFTIVPTKQPDCPYRFEKQVTLPMAANSVSLRFVAKNSGGQAESTRLVYKTKSSNPMATERRVALLIGNKDYANNPLSTTLNDVDDMEEKLKKLNFKVIKHKNLTQKDMNSVFFDFGKELLENDVALFFYAGHGMQNSSGVNYLIPTDCPPITSNNDFPKYCIEINDLFNRMSNSSTKVNIIILDACRTNPPISMAGTRGGMTARGFSDNVKVPMGSVIVYATQANNVAFESKTERNGFFTGALLKFIDKPGLSLNEIIDETAQNVIEKTEKQQIPAVYKQMFGKFYFIK